jgi:hypothetical protein
LACQSKIKEFAAVELLPAELADTTTVLVVGAVGGTRTRAEMEKSPVPRLLPVGTLAPSPVGELFTKQFTALFPLLSDQSFIPCPSVGTAPALLRMELTSAPSYHAAVDGISVGA